MNVVCCICRKGPATADGGVAVFRINAKGVPGIWACEQHISQTDGAPIDPEVLRIAHAAAGRKPA